MELLHIKPVKHREELLVVEHEELAVEKVSTGKPFIEANSIECSLSELKYKHFIPSFSKDGEPLISQSDFIETAMQVAAEVFEGETILKPNIRLSHEIRGSLASSKNKALKDLLEHERTLYYERLAFLIEVPTISGIVDGNSLSLMIGGIKNYGADNLNNRIGADQKFSFFIGFRNKICSNSLISTDGLISNVSVKDIGQLKGCIRSLLERYNHNYLLHSFESLTNYFLTEQEFANLVGRCRMYNHLPKAVQNEIPQMHFGENQLGMIVRDFYKDQSFSKNVDGRINLWRLYNLFTSANKSTYINYFAERAVNAFTFVYSIKMALDEKQQNWFLN